MIRAVALVGVALFVTPAIGQAQKPDDRWAQILALIMISPDPIHRKSCNEHLGICSEIWASQDVLGKHIMAAKRNDKQGNLLYREVCRFEPGNQRRSCVNIDTEETSTEIRLPGDKWKEIK